MEVFYTIKLMKGETLEMKRTILILALLAFVLLSPLAHAAEVTGPFYVGVLGGYVMPSNMNVHDKTGATADFDASLNNGGLVGVKVGYLPPFASGYLATELEYNYIFNTDLDNSKTTAVGTLDGSNKIHAFFLNFKLRYPEGALHPYVAVGPGYAWFNAGDLKISPAGTTSSGDTAGKFCWQIMAGLDYDITRNWGVGIGYKYFQVKPSIGGGINSDYDYKASIVTVGVNYTF